MHILTTFYFFFFNDTATTEIYTLSLHDALPIFRDEDDEAWKIFRLRAQPIQHPRPHARPSRHDRSAVHERVRGIVIDLLGPRSEEHTSELQSRLHLVCRLLLEKKKKECICYASH